jgi:hypothetical protein
MSNRILVITLLVALALIASLVGCVGISNLQPDARSDDPSNIITHAGGEVPEKVLDAIINDLIQQTGVERVDIRTIRAEAVVWDDASLGCPDKGEPYLQKSIHGYWVVAQIEGVYYDYRVSNSGHFILCERKDMPTNPAPEAVEPTQEPLVVQAREDLASRLYIQSSEIELIKFEAVTWPDSSLGCPQPGMVYADVLTPGYLIILSAANKEFEYHASRGAEVFYCENPSPPVLGGANDT